MMCIPMWTAEIWPWSEWVITRCTLNTNWASKALSGWHHTLFWWRKKKWNYEKIACALQFNLMWKPKVRIWISCWLKFQSGDCSSTSSQMTWRAEKSGQQSKQGCFVQNWLLWTKCQVNCSITAVIYWLLKKMCFQTQVCCGELCGCSAWKKKKKKKKKNS